RLTGRPRRPPLAARDQLAGDESTHRAADQEHHPEKRPPARHRRTRPEEIAVEETGALNARVEERQQERTEDRRDEQVVQQDEGGERTERMEAEQLESPPDDRGTEDGG